MTTAKRTSQRGSYRMPPIAWCGSPDDNVDAGGSAIAFLRRNPRSADDTTLWMSEPRPTFALLRTLASRGRRHAEWPALMSAPAATTVHDGRAPPGDENAADPSGVL